jgi:FkbM family methyltransferase
MKISIMRLGVAIAKACYGKGIGGFPFIIGFWEFFCSKIARFDRVKVGFRSLSIWVDPADMGCGIGLMMRGERFDSFLVGLYDAMLRPGMNVVDVGANIGFTALIAARQVGEGGRVFAFEPNPYNYDFLVSNIRENGAGNIMPLQKAAADAAGEIEMFLYPHRRSGSARGRIYRPENGWQSIAVEAITIDEFCEKNDVSVGFVKIDVEGAEEKVVRGMERTIDRNPSLAIVMEFSPQMLTQAGSSPASFFDRVQQKGFNMYDIGEQVVTPLANSSQALTLCEAAGGLNILCTRQALPEALRARMADGR